MCYDAQMTEAKFFLLFLCYYSSNRYEMLHLSK